MQRFMRKHKRKIVAAICIIIAISMLAGSVIGIVGWFLI